nr:hypothetical protein [Tanacetum cinerariifolium]
MKYLGISKVEVVGEGVISQMGLFGSCRRWGGVLQVVGGRSEEDDVQYIKAQLHALVDGKEIIIIESSIRRDLRLADEEGIDCLPNSTIFEQLTLMGPKTTAWNEFSSTMASTIICLATNQKFNFSKFIFDSMIRNLDNLSDKAAHKELCDRLVRAATTASSLEATQDSGGGPWCQETIGGTTAQTRVLDLEKTTTTQRNEISSLKRRVKKLKKKNRSRSHRLKRLYKVGLMARVEPFGNEESLGEDASKQGMIDAIDADEEITLVSIQDEVVSNDANKEMFDVDVLDGEEMFVAKHEVAVKGVNDEVNVVEEVVEVINTTKLILMLLKIVLLVI